MTANAVVWAKINGDIKKDATAVLAAKGLTPSDAFRILMTKIAKEKALPFDPFVPNEKTIAAMKEAREGKLKSFTSIDDLMADLNAND
jgi:DNA-damage-inducible protein J